jgi:hypothetical protein
MVGGRTATHVGQKGIVRMKPAFAHGYSPAAVAWVPAVMVVRATFTEVYPRLVFRRPRSASGFAVRCQHRSELIPVVAAATQSASRPKAAGPHDAFGAAITQAQPLGASAWRVRSGNDSEPSESLSALEWNEARHRVIVHPKEDWFVAQ